MSLNGFAAGYSESDFIESKIVFQVTDEAFDAISFGSEFAVGGLVFGRGTPDEFKAMFDRGVGQMLAIGSG